MSPAFQNANTTSANVGMLLVLTVHLLIIISMIEMNLFIKQLLVELLI